ncbi:MAG: hypothetical protein AAFP76_06845 [Bacteroidota bacterium]
MENVPLKTVSAVIAIFLFQINMAQIQNPRKVSTELAVDVKTYTGIISEQYANGSPRLWKEMSNGKAEGLWKEWFPNGKLRYRAYWENNMGNGKWEYFYANGQLRSESFYINDLAQGIYRTYHKNGQLESDVVYLNGRKHGMEFIYDVDGVLLYRKRYTKGVQEIDEPLLFQPGIITTHTANEWDITFTPDGRTAYFTRRLTDGSSQKIYKTRKDASGHWSDPVVAKFSSNRDEGAFISPDGQYFFFGSCRPIEAGEAITNLDMNIWMMTKSDSGWSSPKPLPEKVNKRKRPDDEWPMHYETGPTIDANGNLFYWSKSSSNKGSNLYQTTMKKDGSFTKPKELLPPSHHQGFDSSPTISRDGNLLFFASTGRSDGYGNEDIYYSRLVNGIWSKPKNLGPIVNTDRNEVAPRFSPDGKYFFFSSDRGDHYDTYGEPLWSIYYMETQFLMID